MFHRIRKLKPSVMKKLIPLQGDVTMDNLGLSDDQRARLLEEVNVVFHCAATLRLEAKLKDAIEMNTVNNFGYLFFSTLTNSKSRQSLIIMFKWNNLIGRLSNLIVATDLSLVYTLGSR